MIVGMYRNNKILDNSLSRLKMDYEIRVLRTENISISLADPRDSGPEYISNVTIVLETHRSRDAIINNNYMSVII